jgi:hypothetical protein
MKKALSSLSLAIKGLSIILAATTIIGASSIFVLSNSKAPQKLLTSFVSKNIEKWADFAISIEKIDSNLLSRTHIKNMIIKDKASSKTIASIESLDIRYSPFKIIQHAGYLPNAITWIDVKDATFFINRNSGGTWEIKEVLKKQIKNSRLHSHSFLAQISGLNIHFMDEKGWGKEPIPRPLKDSFQNLNGTATFKDSNVSVVLNGELRSTKKPVVLDVYSDISTRKFSLDFIIEALDMSVWGNYILPFKDYELGAGNPKLKGNIRSKAFLTSSRLPFFYDLLFSLNHTSLKMPFFYSSLEKGLGDVHIYNGTLKESNLQQDLNISKKQAQKLLSLLVKSEVLSENGWIQHSTSIDSLPSTIKTYLLEPPSQIDFKNIQGSMASVPVFGDGNIRTDKKSIVLNIKTDTFNIHTFNQLFSGVNSVNISGDASMETYIHGPLKKVNVHGNIYSKSPQILGLKPRELAINYALKDKKIVFSVENGILLDNHWNGAGNIDLNTKIPHIELTINANIPLKTIFPTSHRFITGNIETEVTFSGNQTSMRLNVHGTSETASLFNQTIRELDTSILFRNKHISHISGDLSINDLNKNFSVKTVHQKNNALSLTYKGSSIPFNDVNPSDVEISPGLLTINGGSIIPTDLSMFIHPKNGIQATFDVLLSGSSFYKKKFNLVYINGLFHDGKINISQLFAENKNESVELSGIFEKKQLHEVSIKLKDLDLYNWDFLKNRFPNSLNVSQGILSAEIDIVSKNNSPFAKGDISLSNGVINDQHIDYAFTSLRFNEGTCYLSKVEVRENASIIKGDSVLKKNDITFIIDSETNLQINDFKKILDPFGLTSGVVNLNGNFSFTNNSLNTAQTSFSAKKLLLNHVYLDTIHGDVAFNNQMLELNNIKINNGSETFSLNGTWNNNDNHYELILEFKNNTISSLTNLIKEAYAEFQSTTLVRENIEEKIVQPNITLRIQSGPKQVTLFDTDDDNPLTYFSQLIKKKERNKTSTFLDNSTTFEGIINGSILIKSGTFKQPIVNANIDIKELELWGIRSKDSEFRMYPKNNDLYYSIVLESGYFGKNPFKTAFSKGKIDKNSLLEISQAEVKTKDNHFKNVLSGHLPLAPIWNKNADTGPLNLSIKLIDDQLSVLSLFTKNIELISNKGIVDLTISGSLTDPIINSQSIELKDTFLAFSENHPLSKSLLLIEKSSIFINQNKIILPKTNIYWGKKFLNTNQFQKKDKNKITVQGTIQMTSMKFLQPESMIADVNLSLLPTKLAVNLPTLYAGDLTLKQASIQGPIEFPISNQRKEEIATLVRKNEDIGVQINADIMLSNGTLFIPKLKKETHYPMIGLNVTTNIETNVSLYGEFIGSGFLAGIATNLDLQSTQRPLMVTGSLNSPLIKNELFIQSGVLDIFNRSFDIIPTITIQRYLPDGDDSLITNSISFSNQASESGEIASVPHINLASLTIIDPQEITSDNGERSSDPLLYDHLAMIISGPLNKLEKITFNHFKSPSIDSFSGNLEFKKRYYLPTDSDQTTILDKTDTQEILKIVMPELFLDKAINSEDLISRFGENKINLLLKKNILRPIEKSISNKIGVYDLRIDYNVGQHIINTNSSDKEQNIGFSIIQKILSDQLFLRVKTNIDMNSSEKRKTNTVDISEMELSYYLLKKRNLSINYANIRDEFGSSRYKSRASLKFSHDY